MAPTSLDRAELEGLSQHRSVAGWVALLVTLPLAGAFLGYGWWARHEVMVAVGTWQLLVLGALITVRSALSARLRLATEPKQAARRWVPWSRRSGPRRPMLLRLAPWTLALLAIALPWRATWAPWAIGQFEFLADWIPLGDARLAEGPATVLGWCSLAGAVLCALLGQYYGNTHPRALPETAGLATWFRASSWVLAAQTTTLLLHAAGRHAYEDGIAQVLRVALVVLAAEMLLRALTVPLSRRARWRPDSTAAIVSSPFALRLLATRFNPSASVFTVLADAFGIDLKGTWALAFIRRSLLPLAVGLAVLGWLSTTLITVPATHVGLLETLGKLDEEPLQPGLHIVAPWPFQRVVRVPVHRVATLPIGYEGKRSDIAIMWTGEHVQNEYSLLLGDGRDLVTVNASLHWRVGDARAWTYSTQNPEQLLGILADRVLLQLTVDRTLDEVLSENVELLAHGAQRSIQAACDSHELGVEIVDLVFTGLHPPVAVAADYQSVVSAQIEKDTKVIEAHTDHEERMPAAQGEAQELHNQALAHQVRRLSAARGEGAAFSGLVDAYLEAPSLFRFRRQLEALEARLAGKSFHVIDDGIEKDGGAVWYLD